MSLPFSEYYRNNNPHQQMALRGDRKVIKLEAAYGSERQFIVIKRNQDLIVHDVLEEIQKTFKIPVDQQVIFHKGTNLCDFPSEKLENLGIENNHLVRITRDQELPSRSPRSRLAYIQQANNLMNNGIIQNNKFNTGLDSVSYLKEISPQRVPDPTPFQVQVYNQNMGVSQNKSQGQSDVLKLYVSYGSEREYMLVHGKKPLLVSDLKGELTRLFKIQPDQQCIVFKGYNIHEYTDDAPLEAFGLENNSPISLWPKGNSSQLDIRLPRGSSPQPQMMPDMFSPRIPPPPGSLSQRWNGPEGSTEVLKIEVQHGSDRHQVMLKGQNKTLTVLDLQNELEKITAVGVRDQRLFFKAQELHTTPFKTLKDCELENNHVVKLVGEPSKVRYSNFFGRLAVPANGSTSSSDLNTQQQHGYQPNFYQQQQQPQQFKQQQNFGYSQNF